MRFLVIGLTLAIGANSVVAQPPAPKTPEQSKFINEYFAKTWKANSLTPSAKATDHEICRRVYLDLLGRIPKPDEVKAFVSSGANRAALVKKLLYDKKEYSEEFSRHMADAWTVWLLTRSGNATYHEQMHLWLEEQFAKNASYKDMVRQLVTAKGKTNDNGAVNFILAHLGENIPQKQSAEEGNFEMVPITSRTTRLFLGLQTQCVQCHDHPFNPEWKQQAFWGVNAFYRQVSRGGNPITRQPNRMEQATVLELKDDSTVNRDGIVYYERRNGMILPTPLTFVDGRRAEASTGQSRRDQLAEMILTHENFPKAIINRYWGVLIGRGLNEQATVDDFGEHNKVIHPELLDKLGKDFAYANYDLKELLTWICCSDVYGLSSKFSDNRSNAKPETDVFFSRMLLKTMSPEQLLESLWVATQGKTTGEIGDSKDREKRKNEWTRKLVTNFGDDEGNEITFNGTVVQALLLINGKEINDEIKSSDGTIAKSMKAHKGNFGPIINDIFMASLGRPPQTNEPAIVNKIANKYGGKFDQSFYGDVMWALLNSHEFILNH
jgi:Protein of unknown function (DUF1549)/Protein of unknown function (DUF1553)